MVLETFGHPYSEKEKNESQPKCNTLRKNQFKMDQRSKCKMLRL